MKRILAFFLTIGALVSCGREEIPPVNHSLFIYIAGRNTLSGMVSDCFNQLGKGYLPPTGSREEAVLVYVRNYEDNPKLFRISRDAEGKMQKEILFNYPSDQNSASAGTLEEVIMDVENLCPATTHGLVLWSHSSGWLPEGYMENPDKEDFDMVLSGRKQANPKQSFGKDESSATSCEMELADLSDAIPFKYDYIIFDSCLMGCVEVAYELKDKCDFIAFSPAEIKSQGFPYYMMTESLFRKPLQTALTEICEEYYRFYKEDFEKSPWNSGGTISLVRTDGMEALSGEFAAVVRNHRDAIYALDNVQGYFRYDCHWFYDIDDIVEQVSSPQEVASFREALDKAVVYKAATDGFMLERGGFSISHYCGLSSFIPRIGREERLKQYYRQLNWNKATRLVE